jgi:hypothetical protein
VEKAAIVAESLAPGAVTSAIALRHGLHRNQLYGWRREFRSAAVADAGVPASDFVPIVAASCVGSCAAVIEIEIEIEIDGSIMRVGPIVSSGGSVSISPVPSAIPLASWSRLTAGLRIAGRNAYYSYSSTMRPVG